jgi:predicted ester cyclase
VADADVSHIRGCLRRYGEGDPDAISDLIAPDFFTHVPAAEEPTATRVYADFAAEFKAAAPDLSVDIPDLAMGEDGRFHGTAVISGTQTGLLWGIPASGRSFLFRVPVTLRAADGGYAANVELDPPGVMAILRELEVINPPDQMHLPPRHPVVISDFLIKVLFTGQVADKPCRHLADVRVTRPTTDTCDDCSPGEIWPTVRLCLTCGHAGCCDTSTNKHARAHWEQTGHPLMRSIRMDEGWIWCYEDAALFQKRTLERIEARLASAG